MKGLVNKQRARPIRAIDRMMNRSSTYFFINIVSDNTLESWGRYEEFERDRPRLQSIEIV
jgi:hypothetical protein